MHEYAIRKSRLSQLIADRFDGNRSRFCEATGEDPTYVSRLYSKNPAQAKPFTETIARRIETALNLPKGWLDNELDAMADNLKNYLAEQRAPYGDEIVMIPFVDAQVGAGPGVSNGDERTLDLHQYSRAWIDKNGLHAPALRRVKVAGDSMRPTIFDGDVALVNTAERKITNGKVFAFIVDGEARVKRLFKQFDGRIRVVSDNPDKLQFPDEFLTPDHMPEMVGRVVDRSGKADL